MTRCVQCERTQRTTYIGNGKRAKRGNYCYKCGKQKNKETIK